MMYSGYGYRLLHRSFLLPAACSTHLKAGSESLTSFTPEHARLVQAKRASDFSCVQIKESRHWDISANERLEILKQFCSAGLLHWGSDAKGVETTR